MPPCLAKIATPRFPPQYCHPKIATLKLPEQDCHPEIAKLATSILPPSLANIAPHNCHRVHPRARRHCRGEDERWRWANCSPVQYSTVKLCTVQYSTALYNTVHHCTVLYSTALYSTVLGQDCCPVATGQLGGLSCPGSKSGALLDIQNYLDICRL